MNFSLFVKLEIVFEITFKNCIKKLPTKAEFFNIFFASLFLLLIKIIS